MLKAHTLIALLAMAIMPSCMPFKTVSVIDPSISRSMPKELPKVSKTTKVFISGDVSWGGKPAPIANGYFKKRLKNVIQASTGYEYAKEKEADLIVYVKRNNKFDKADIQRKINRLIRKQSNCEIVANMYDHVITINGSGKSWSGNVPHTVHMVMGDGRQSSVVGQSNTMHRQGASILTALEWDDAVAADEAMIRQVLGKAFLKAKQAGCY